MPRLLARNVSPTTLNTDRFLLPTPELDEVVASIAAVSSVYADLVRVLAHTGLRWGGARATLVRDCSEVPMPMLSVVRNQPEGVAAAQTPKSGQSRCVPLPDALLPVIRRFAEGKSPDELLFIAPAAGSCIARCSCGKRTGPRPVTGVPCTTCATPRPASGSFRVCR